MPEMGDKFTYSHESGAGFGEAALGQPLTAEMSELDMQDGTEVTYLQNDEESAWPIVEWTDGVGINRITTIDPALFEANFHPVGEES
jgi:hypothetical protein